MEICARDAVIVAFKVTNDIFVVRHFVFYFLVQVGAICLTIRSLA